MSGPLVLAHRGANRLAPENTLEAFAVAVGLGADGVELDVRRTADATLVVHHDAEAPGLGLLASQPLGAIRAARPEIPTLDEALDACAGRLVDVEVKNLPGDADWDPGDTAAALVVETLRRRAGRDDVLVSSFNLASIDRVRELEASIPTAWLLLAGFDLADAADLARARGHAAIHPDLRSFADPRTGGVARETAAAVVAHAHGLGLQVNVWTVNDDDAILRLADAGVDAVITDVPDTALQVLGRGGIRASRA